MSPFSCGAKSKEKVTASSQNTLNRVMCGLDRDNRWMNCNGPTNREGSAVRAKPSQEAKSDLRKQLSDDDQERCSTRKDAR